MQLMRSIKNKNLKYKLVILFLFSILILTSCDNSAEFEEKAPPKKESRRVLVDVKVTSFADKTTFDALFYYDITEIVDGKEIQGFGKDVIKVQNAKLGDKELKESKNEAGQIIYTTEIPNEVKEYELTFTPNENMQAKHKIEIDPIFISEKVVQVKRVERKEFKLSRLPTNSELPMIAEMKNANGKFMPARIGYENESIAIGETSLNPFKNENSEMRIRFESNRGSRDKNKSIGKFDYVIQREVKIAE